MSSKRYPEKFKIEAVRQVVARGHSVAEAAISYCEAHKGFVSRDFFNSILKTEEEHVDWLKNQLELVEKLGEQDYLRSAR